MPDIFPQCINLELDVTNDVILQQRIEFPLVVADTSKRLLQELIAWEVDYTALGTFTQGAQDETIQATISLTLSKPASTEIVCEFGASVGTGQTIGNTNVIDRLQFIQVAEDDGTSAYNFFSLGGPIVKSLNRGGLGVLLPQDHLWVNVYASVDSFDTQHIPIGIRLWYRQRPIKADEFLGLLASRTQEVND